MRRTSPSESRPRGALEFYRLAPRNCPQGGSGFGKSGAVLATTFYALGLVVLAATGPIRRLRESRGFPRNRCPDRRFDEPSGLSCAGAGTARAGRRFQYVDLRRDQRMVPLAVDSGGDRNRSGSLSGAHQRTRPSGPGDPAGPCGGIPGAYWCSAILTSSASVWPKSSSSRPTLRFCSPPTSPRVEGPSGIRERGALILPGGETLHQLRMS